MKKKITYLLIIFISMFMYNEVGAADCDNYACKTCSYDNFIFEISADSTGNLTLTDKHTGTYYFYENNLIANDFYNKNSDTIECMSQIYARLDGGRNGLTASLHSTKCDKCVSKSKTGETGNNKTVGIKNKTKSCDFTGYSNSGSIKVTLTSDGKKLSAVATSGYKVNIQNISPFSVNTNCGDVVAYVSCGSNQNDKYCTISSEKLTVVPDDDSQTGDETPTVDDHNKGDEKDENKKEPVVTDGETIKIVKRIYDIIKVLIPVLIVILSTVDFLKVVIYDDEKNYKSAFDKLVKRLIIGVIFFLLPILVSFVIKYSGLDVEQSYLEIFK